MATINTIGVGLSGTSGAKAFVGTDVNANTTVNSYIPGSNSTVVADGTTTLTVSDAQIQIFTGSAGTQYCQFPDITTLSIGQSYRVINQSTAVISGLATDTSVIADVYPGNEATFTCLSLTDTTAAAWTTGVPASGSAVLLNPPSDQTILGAYKLILDQGSFVSGNSTGTSGPGSLVLYCAAANTGKFTFAARNNIGNFEGELRNASLTSDQNWSLPDATGTLVLDTQSVLLNPVSDQTIIGVNNLILDQGSFVAGDSFAGSPDSSFVTYSPTGSSGYLRIQASDSPSNLHGVLTNDIITGSNKQWKLPDQTGIITVLGNAVTGTGNIVLDTAPTVSSIAFNPTTQGIVGTTSGDDADPSYVGEYLESAVMTHIALNNSTPTDITSITLSAGDWDVYSNVSFTADTGCNIVWMEGWVSDISATEPPQEYVGRVSNSAAGVVPSTSAAGSITLPVRRVSIPISLTLYLSAFSEVSVATLRASGVISARRVR